MKITKKSKSFRALVLKYKLFHREQGRVIAAKEFDKRIKELSIEFQKALTQRDRTHEIQMLSARKEENKYLDLIIKVDVERAKVKEVLEKMQADQAQISIYSKNLRASWHDEKFKKRNALDHDENEANLLVAEAEKIAKRII